MKRFFDPKGLTLLAIASAAVLSFQNCSKAKFAAGDGASAANQSDSTSSASASGIISTAAGIAANPPPAAATVCTFGDGSADGTCNLQHAFVGNLFVEPRALLTDSGNRYGNGPIQGDMNVNDYVSSPSWMVTKSIEGVSQPVVVALSSLDSVLIPFSTGFQTQDGQSIQVPDASGRLGSVPNYFALDLRGNFHLAPDDQPGQYQIAVVADDGAQIYTTDASGGNPKMLVDDQVPAAATSPAFIPGSQYARMGCSPVIGDASKIKTLTMAQDTVVPLELRYVNGPSGLSLRVMYRLVPAAGPRDPFCETDINGDPSTRPTVDSGFLDMSQLGSWKTITADNL